jgi:small multidrug resistance pump
MSEWLYLAIAIIFEVAGTTAMKVSDGFSKLLPSIAMSIFYILSLAALTYALKKIDMSMAYAIWAGVGTALITTIGIVVFKEEVSFLKVVSVILIIAGVVGLHLANRG